MATGPVVTVGMPLYNNARTIVRALESLQRQSHGALRLVLSDDGSRDDTARICGAYAARDPRITLTVQPRNLRFGNFRWVLQQATSPYFMFAAGDDWWEPEFVAANLAVLERQPEVVGSVSRVLFHDASGRQRLSTGTAPLQDSPRANLRRYFDGPGDNSRMYGVFRTEVLRRCFPRWNCHAYDWVMMASTLRMGTHAEVPEVLMHREETPADQYVEDVRRDHRNPIFRVFPLLSASLQFLAGGPRHLSYAVLRALAGLNSVAHRRYVERFHPRYARLVFRQR